MPRKYYNLFNDMTRLVAATDIQLLMVLDEPPSKCLCGNCKHDYSTFQPEAQQATFGRWKKYRAFFSDDHIRIYKHKHQAIYLY